MPRERAWVRYIEAKYGVTLTPHRRALDIEDLTATQSEIEQIKYDLVRHEAFRAGEPILAYKGRFGGYYLVDGHTRARVHWDMGERSIEALLYTSADAEVCAELGRIAVEAGGGRARRVAEVPVVDRVGKGTAAWDRRRQELLEEWMGEARQGEKEAEERG